MDLLRAIYICFYLLWRRYSNLCVYGNVIGEKVTYSLLVGAAGFEPWTLCLRHQWATTTVINHYNMICKIPKLKVRILVNMIRIRNASYVYYLCLMWAYFKGTCWKSILLQLQNSPTGTYTRTYVDIYLENLCLLINILLSQIWETAELHSAENIWNCAENSKGRRKISNKKKTIISVAIVIFK